ncbi:MAG: hypothetical protein QQW96_13530 [Tychonema bourrellyi B0820]|nr:hypothetical protein [Tychonema bourrellyi]MDQ2098656.1 hypothetical protein [Tychonema bourrellyi B0820]
MSSHDRKLLNEFYRSFPTVLTFCDLSLIAKLKPIKIPMGFWSVPTALEN